MATRWKTPSLNPEQQRDLKREMLYQVASAEFRRKGYHGTSLDDVARQLGISKATLYYYVKNKQDLLYQCHLVAADQAIAAVCSDPELTGLEQLRRTIIDYTTSIICDTSFSVVILEERSLNDEQLATVIKKRTRFERKLQSIIRSGLDDGSITACDPKFAVFCILGASNWVTKWHRPNGEWGVAEIAEAVALLLCGGLASQHARQDGANRLYGSTITPSVQPQKATQDDRERTRGERERGARASTCNRRGNTA
ncbi:MAG: TetR/AcrR family transcriptional regulator [Burkholderiaceae bacterium]|jgi:AcrR family transcriptional regulator|nr:TetR/AcrR family transcriptional regulator [Burkholderiaceae bacterium]